MEDKRRLALVAALEKGAPTRWEATRGHVLKGADGLVTANVEDFLRRKEARSLTRPWIVLRFIVTPENAAEVGAWRRRWRGGRTGPSRRTIRSSRRFGAIPCWAG